MFDPDFDPLLELTLLKTQQQQTHENILQIARAFNDRSEVFNQLVGRIKELDIIVEDLQKQLDFLTISLDTKTIK